MLNPNNPEKTTKLNDILRSTKKFEEQLSCLKTIKLMLEYKRRGITPDKFPATCRNCWKVLVFDVSKEEVRYIGEKILYPSKALPMEDNPNKYLVVIYTRSVEERDEVRRRLEMHGQVKGRIRYRFACRAFQDDFPEMFISAGKPNPKYL